MNSTIEILTKRFSVRTYLEQQISNEHKQLIEEVIYRSPTAGNMQDFSVIVIEDQELKTKLAQLCDNQLFIAKAPLLYIFVSDFTRYKDYFDLSNVDDSKFKIPHYGTMMNGIIDATIAAQSASVAANSLGIGTCYIGDILENKEQITKLLNLNENMIPVAMLTCGYFKLEVKLSPKIDKKYIIHQNKYTRATSAEIKEIFASKKVPKKYVDQFANFGEYYYATKVGADFSQEMNRSMSLYLDNFKQK